MRLTAAARYRCAGMAGKKEGQPISFRVDPDIARTFDDFVDSRRGWSKTEAVITALHHFLTAMTDEQRVAAMLRYRTRQDGPPTSDAKPPRPKK